MSGKQKSYPLSMPEEGTTIVKLCISIFIYWVINAFMREIMIKFTQKYLTILAYHNVIIISHKNATVEAK